MRAFVLIAALAVAAVNAHPAKEKSKFFICIMIFELAY